MGKMRQLKFVGDGVIQRTANSVEWGVWLPGLATKQKVAEDIDLDWAAGRIEGVQQTIADLRSIQQRFSSEALTAEQAKLPKARTEF